MGECLFWVVPDKGPENSSVCVCATTCTINLHDSTQSGEEVVEDTSSEGMECDNNLKQN